MSARPWQRVDLPIDTLIQMGGASLAWSVESKRDDMARGQWAAKEEGDGGGYRSAAEVGPGHSLPFQLHLAVCSQCTGVPVHPYTRTHSPHPPPWPGRSLVHYEPAVMLR